MKRWEDELPICPTCGQKKRLSDEEADALQLQIFEEERRAHPEVSELGDETGG
jgi:hypothetical protein